MKNAIYYVLLLLFCAQVLAEEEKKLYKWVDEQGNVHYSDEPQNGAKEIHVKPLATTKIEPTRSFNLPQYNNSALPVPSATDSGEADKVYQQIAMQSPANDDVIRNNASELTLTAALTPELMDGHSIRFFLDGRLIGTDEKSVSATVKEVSKGEHSVSFIVVDQQGKQLQASETIKFHFLNRINQANKKKNSN